MRMLTPENILLVGSIMLFFSLLVGKMGFKFGIPSLLLFLFVGMAMGQDGLGYHFDSAETTQFIGIMALSIILFSGGMDTKYGDIRPVFAPGVVLATLGVVFTAGVTAFFIWSVSEWFGYPLNFAESLLLASVMSSTDSASVFSLLRSKSLKLRENLRPTLELESGSNDPMAYILTIVLIGYITSGDMGWEGAVEFATQMTVGAVCGWGLGRGIVWLVNAINFDSTALYSVLMVTCVLFTFSFTDKVGGNGYLAVYLAGLIVGNRRTVHKRSIANFFDGFTWLWQIVMFLTLGLLVNPRELMPVAGFGLAVGAFMIVLGRPLAVFACLLPFRKFSLGARLYVSWVGLRGAVPIIFATYPLIAEVPHARLMFNVVFFITIVSLLVQGMSVGPMAKVFGVADAAAEPPREFGVELPEEITAAMSEITVSQSMLAKGNLLMNLTLPDKALVMMMKRHNKYLVPKGRTELKAGDKLLVISDDDEALKKAYAAYGIKDYRMEKNV